ncbi:MAG: universal stress protein [Deltaproteobacteria bacterium]|nr:universal stress protein [Deltaproteobacteria bacterium]
MLKNTILVPLNESIISQVVIDYLINIGFDPEQVDITLLHIFRKPSAEEELMGKKFAKERIPKIKKFLNRIRKKLVDNGFFEAQTKIKILTKQYSSVTDGIIDQFKKNQYKMVMIGRRRMSKSEEFVLGDISIKLVRALEETAVVVVKSK